LKYATATINDNKIEATATTNAYAVTIQKVESQSYYTIKLANGQYLGTPNSNSIKQGTSVTSDFYWKFSVSNSLVKIEANSYSGRILRLNGTSGFRTYTSNTGTQATLYRLEGGESGGETPDPTPDEPSTGVSKTAKITFGSNAVKISAASVTGTDSENNNWTITTVGTTSYTANSAYYQVGSSSKPATSITFTTTLPAGASVSNVEAKFGGFSSTAGNVTLKVGDTSVGTGKLNATSDVIVKSTSTASGNKVTVTVTNIAKGVKCYYISVNYTE
jgi:hypothetical protein